MTWEDTTTLIHVRRAELVQLETLREIRGLDTVVVLRSAILKTVVVDTLAAASTALQSDHSADTTQTLTTHPLTAPSKKKGLAWLCPLVVFGCVIFLYFFSLALFRLKK